MAICLVYLWNGPMSLQLAALEPPLLFVREADMVILTRLDIDVVGIRI